MNITGGTQDTKLLKFMENEEVLDKLITYYDDGEFTKLWAQHEEQKKENYKPTLILDMISDTMFTLLESDLVDDVNEEEVYEYLATADRMERENGNDVVDLDAEETEYLVMCSGEPKLLKSDAPTLNTVPRIAGKRITRGYSVMRTNGLLYRPEDFRPANFLLGSVRVEGEYKSCLIQAGLYQNQQYEGPFQIHSIGRDGNKIVAYLVTPQLSGIPKMIRTNVPLELIVPMHPAKLAMWPIFRKSCVEEIYYY